LNHFLVEPGSVNDNSIRITGEDVHHIKDVLRLKPGDRVTVSTGDAGLFLCSIEKISDESVRTAVVEKIEEEAPGFKIIVAQAIPKGRKMDDVVRMAAELGVFQVIPVIAGRCVAKPGDNFEKKIERWRAVALAAAKQSRAFKATRVSPPVTLSMLPQTIKTDLDIVLWEDEKTSLKSVLTGRPEPRSAMVLIGPEGGFGEDEINLLKQNGYVSASFGKRILRTETAGVAVVSAMIYHYGK